mgnify:CR=1 FL=1
MKIRNLFILSVSVIFASCASFGPKPKTSYHRKDIKTPVKKLIVFPVTDFQGKQSSTTKKIEAAFVGKWNELYGASNVIPGGPVLYKLLQKSGSGNYKKLIKSLDNISMVEQLHKDKRIRDLVSKVTSKLKILLSAVCLKVRCTVIICIFYPGVESLPVSPA